MLVIFMDLGNYECIGRNVAGEDIATVQLFYAGASWSNAIHQLWSISSEYFVDPPTITIEKSHLLAAPGDDVALRCDISSELHSNIRWLKDDALVNCFCLNEYIGIFKFKITRHQTNSDGHLEIKGASAEYDSGNYTCFVQNSVGSSSAVLRLDVGSKTINLSNSISRFCLNLAKPIIRLISEEEHVPLGQSVRLLCDTQMSPKSQIK